jgi:chemotaxis protein histidine kinase CheA
MSATVTMTAAMERALRTACVEMGDAMLTSLAEHYKMDMEELRRVSGVSDLVVSKAVKKATSKKERKSVPKKDKKPVPSMPLPFVGLVDDEVCYGIRLNHGLHTQCSNDRVEGLEYCKTCVKQAEKNASGKPTYGDIRDRTECGILEYRDPKGKQTLPYINVVEKLGLDMDAVKAEAAKFGIEIPEEHLVKRETKRGRPKKDTTSVSDTSSEASQPKKRGRPKKEKKVESVVGDDLLAALKNAQADAKKVATVAEDAQSVKSTTSKKSGGRPRLSDEEKAKRAEEKAKAKAAAKAEKEAAKAKAKAEKEAEKAKAKAEKEAAKAKAKAEKEAAKVEAEEEAVATPAEEEDAVKVKKFELNGVTYLRTDDNILYDIETQEPVGIYDPETGAIEEVEAVSDDEDEEDDE